MGIVFSAGTEKLVRVDVKMYVAKYKAVLEENLVEDAKDCGGCSPPSRTMTRNMQPELQWDRIDQNIVVC